jgi:hypothetical protein
LIKRAVRFQKYLITDPVPLKSPFIKAITLSKAENTSECILSINQP